MKRFCMHAWFPIFHLGASVWVLNESCPVLSLVCGFWPRGPHAGGDLKSLVRTLRFTCNSFNLATEIYSMQWPPEIYSKFCDGIVHHCAMNLHLFEIEIVRMQQVTIGIYRYRYALIPCPRLSQHCCNGLQQTISFRTSTKLHATNIWRCVATAPIVVSFHFNYAMGLISLSSVRASAFLLAKWKLKLKVNCGDEMRSILPKWTRLPPNENWNWKLWRTGDEIDEILRTEVNSIDYLKC